MGIPKASVCVWWERRGEEGGALEGGRTGFELVWLARCASRAAGS